MKYFSINILLLVCLLIIYNINYIMNKKSIYAIAVFTDNVKGTVKFSEDLNNNQIKIDLSITGLKPNSLHGFHVHEAGDLSEKCTSMCSHFNPFGSTVTKKLIFLDNHQPLLTD